MIQDRSIKMKLPYFYQQFLGFLAVIVVLMSVTIVSLVLFGRNTAVRSIEDRLYRYADSITEMELEADELGVVQQLLYEQDVSFFIFDDEGTLVYPLLPSDVRARVVPEHIERLQAGERVALTTNQEDMLGNPRETALIYAPFFDEQENAFQGFVTVSAPVSHIDQQMEELKANLSSAFLISTILAVLMSFVFARYQVGRVNRLRKAAHKVAEGEYSIQLDHKERDEIDYLSRDFNRMVIALRHSQDEVNRQEERRKTFMQDAAHEMRTPLTTINGLLEGLEYDVIPESQRLRSIKLMRKETKRLIRLVNENLDYENIRSNRIVLNKHDLPVSEILAEIKDQMGRIAEESGNTLKVHSMEGLFVYADYDRFKQILVNLIKNAIQFTNDGVIEVDGEDRPDGTRILVKDNGIGMNDEQIKNIWDRYYKADASRTNTAYGESGLGLSIVHQLVEQHGGQIEVASALGKGTTFIITFPKRPANQ